MTDSRRRWSHGQVVVMRAESFEGPDAWLNGWVEVLRSHNGDEAAEAATQLLLGAMGLGLKVKKQSQEDRGFSIALVVPGLAYWPDCTPSVAHDKGGRIGWEVARLKKHRPFDSPPMTDRFLARLRTIPGLHTFKQSYPDVRFADLAADEGVPRFLEVLAWVAEKVRRYN